MIEDYFKIALDSILRRKMRSWLTMIGIFIGIAAVVALISVGQGMQDAINEQFEKMGTDKVIVMPGGDTGSPIGAFMAEKKLTKKDVDVVKRVKDVDLVAGMLTKAGKVEYKDETKYIMIGGIPVDETQKIVKDIESYDIEFGRDLAEQDKFKAVIGYGVANDLFKKKVRIKDKISISDKNFRVVGILEKVGSMMEDNSVIIPLDVARDLFDEKEEVSAIFVKVEKGVTPSDAAEKIEKELRDYKNEDEGEESFNVQTFEQILERVDVVLDIVQAVLIGIALISLFVGGIGIMNTMYTSVLERTREVGIMKAVGATDLNIMLIFMLESGIYGLVGGIVGIILGLSMSKAVEMIAGMYLGIGLLQASMSWWLIVGALAFSFVIGCISGVLPAKQAANLEPVDALRYE